MNRLLFGLNKVQGTYPKVNGLITIVNKRGSIKFGVGGVINSSSMKNIIGGDVRSTIVVNENAKLEVGNNFKMSNSAIYCASGITIGNNVMIGGSCRIWDTDFHPMDPEQRRLTPNDNFKSKPITIGNDVFIGGFSIILKGVTIGDAAIVGAGSVVSRSIPSGEVWAGNPARFVKKIDGYARQTL